MEFRIDRFLDLDYDEAYALWARTPGMGLSEADSRERITAFLDRNPGLCFVARDSKGALVGTILCGSDSRRGYLYHLAVDESARRMGLGSALAERGEKALKESGVEKCHLMVIAGNELGGSFWRSRGYKLRTDIDLYSKSL